MLPTFKPSDTYYPKFYLYLYRKWDERIEAQLKADYERKKKQNERYRKWYAADKARKAAANAKNASN